MRLSKVDPSSYSEPESVIIKHIDIDWIIDFDAEILQGKAYYKLNVLDKPTDKILFDVNDITINSIEVVTPQGSVSLQYEISDLVKNIGSKLSIHLPTLTDGDFNLLITYKTSNKASALQWLTKEQTLGKEYPYLFSQCQAISARSILPCQDTAAVKFTYNATLRHPETLTALMSAIRVKNEPGITYFEQTVCIPSYLLAIAVGRLASKKIGPISRVWAEQEIVDEAAEEFSETQRFIEAAEDICGPYLWKQYDLLVMPPSFPFGGMENPCLTFVTPTLLAGDKSLANVVAHEIAHSWTGNLVTNRNYEHFWLNEGFTVFVEHKIDGRMYGAAQRDFQSVLGLNSLKETIKDQTKDKELNLSKLVIDLSNLSPDDAYSIVPYMKGSTFLRYLEDLFGGPSKFEPFLKSYLNKYKYKSLLSEDFKKTLYDYFNDGKHDVELAQVDWDTWLYAEGMPPELPKYDTSLVDICERHAKLWAENPVYVIEGAKELNDKLTSSQIIYFLSQLFSATYITDFNNEKVTLLTKVYELDKTKNAEIRFVYFRLCILARLTHKMDDIITFMNSNFRMKFVRPLYRDLAGWPEMKQVAIDNYNKVKDQMMTVCSVQVAKDLGLSK